MSNILLFSANFNSTLLFVLVALGLFAILSNGKASIPPNTSEEDEEEDEDDDDDEYEEEDTNPIIPSEFKRELLEEYA